MEKTPKPPEDDVAGHEVLGSKDHESKLIRDPTISLRKRLESVTRGAYQYLTKRNKDLQTNSSSLKQGRCIQLQAQREHPLVDAHRGQPYISNNIRTSRYTVWDFIPKQLFFQFSRIGNFYFLCVGIPQMIPGLSTTGSYTTILPLLFFVLLTIFKEGFDDYRRYRLDKVENANFTTVLGKHNHYLETPKAQSWIKLRNPLRTKICKTPREAPNEEFQGNKWVPVRWSNVHVGDIIRLSRDEPVPADIVLLHSAGENNLAYVETMALDGETNLKTKQVPEPLGTCDTIEAIAGCLAEFHVENPNPDLFSFDGRVTIDGNPSPLTLTEVIYRGSVLRNTKFVIGLVINTGEECKIRKNSNQHPKAKKPALERVVNRIVITLAAYVVIVSVGVSMGYVRWQKSFENYAWYLENAAVPFHEIIIAFIIMFNNVVPLALYISLEIVKIGQLLMLNSDIEMYDEETDTPARCNTNTILENLGQVGYIFSDKTGTLTDNVMKFRKLSIAGTVWLHQKDLEDEELLPETFPQSSLKSPKIQDDTSSTDPSVDKAEPITIMLPDDPSSPLGMSTSPTPSRPGMWRRSSSVWRSTGRPDHVQPEVNTTDLLEYIRLRPTTPFARKAREYFLALALCHTCLPELKGEEVEMQSSSPDELALVKAAQELGFGVVQRTARSITLKVLEPDNEAHDMTFEILDVIEFTSERKRMSIIVRFPDGRICLICKGADSAILPRLKLSSLAKQKATEVRKSVQLEREVYRKSEQMEPRNSFGGRPSLTIRRNPAIVRDRSTGRQASTNRSKSFEASRIVRRSDERRRPTLSPRGVSFDTSKNHFLDALSHYKVPLPDHLEFLDERSIFDESEIFTQCFRHLDDFATEGLRTLLFAQRFLPEREYAAWKSTYTAATTSLENRQELIAAAAEKIEDSFNLVGATAIEDKLQKGVPETIDRLRRANIKIWMLTGDKRETAINIAHSARICRPGSDLYILDVVKGGLSGQLTELTEELLSGSSIHSVVVIDGHTLSIVEASKQLLAQFFAVMVRVDSVICCRASPAQKSLLVRTIRTHLKTLKGKQRRGLTLAIGDGANDLAMIQASHVGIGISGKEGLQAARVADYSIAQFRFLQRLLLVHGRWNYVRTAKFILCTFWKEMFFYLPTAQYQRYNGYSGTSLYESTSLTVFNTLFTSLCTICMGIWEQDLQAETLLAVPELYIYGQRSKGLNLTKYVRWMLLAAIEGVVAWYGVWAGYSWISPLAQDEGLYALGQLAFTVGVLWINWKLLIIETHYKTTVVMASFFVTTWAWFAWMAFLSSVYAPSPSGTYAIRDGFIHRWGRDTVWWSTCFIVLGFLGIIDMTLKIAKRQLQLAGYWHFPPWKKQPFNNISDENPEELDLELWQEMEQDPVLRERFKMLARDEHVEEEMEEEIEVE